MHLFVGFSHAFQGWLHFLLPDPPKCEGQCAKITAIAGMLWWKHLVDGNFKGSQQNSRTNGARRFVGHRCSLTQVQAVSIAQQNGFAAAALGPPYYLETCFFHIPILFPGNSMIMYDQYLAISRCWFQTVILNFHLWIIRLGIWLVFSKWAQPPILILISMVSVSRKPLQSLQAHMLDKESFSSASAAVDALNRGWF